MHLMAYVGSLSVRSRSTILAYCILPEHEADDRLFVDEAGIQFHVLNKSKGPAVHVGSMFIMLGYGLLKSLTL